MAADTSEQVLLLLQELSTLKKMDINSEDRPAESRGENQLRQERKQEIIEEIKALAEQKKGDDQTIRGNSETESKSPEEKRGL